MSHASTMCRVHSRCKLIKASMSVYIVYEQLIRHQPVVWMLARSEDFSICVVCALFHTARKCSSSNRAVLFRVINHKSCLLNSMCV